MRPSGLLSREDGLAPWLGGRPEGYLRIEKKTPDNDNLTGSSQRLTTAWWEEDEIECVWLGEGRIEHKPALRKITIYSRWLQRFPYMQKLTFHTSQSWGLA